jgi:hypothetical protein
VHGGHLVDLQDRLPAAGVIQTAGPHQIFIDHPHFDAPQFLLERARNNSLGNLTEENCNASRLFASAQLAKHKKVGIKECVALVQQFGLGAGPSTAWKEGDAVLGNKDIASGTAIATFVKGRYPSLRHGNHAAFFIAQAVDGFWVMDQWRDDGKKPLVSKRLIRTEGKKQLANGTWPGGGDNAYAYSIIER